MADGLAILELRVRLDQEKRRADEAERENARLNMLLSYAEAAIMEEYRLRVNS